MFDNKETEKYLSKLNANNIFYAGNLKLIDNNISMHKIGQKKII